MDSSEGEEAQRLLDTPLGNTKVRSVQYVKCASSSESPPVSLGATTSITGNLRGKGAEEGGRAV